MTDTIHGHPILASVTTPAKGANRAGRVILVDRGPRHENFERFVTAWQGGSASTGFDPEWTWGHYFDSETEASEDFLRRGRRGY